MATRAVEVANGVPGLAPERAVTWPKRTKARLSNGLEVILAEAHSIPKFHGELFFRSGDAAASHRAPGLAPRRQRDRWPVGILEPWSVWTSSSSYTLIES